MKKFILSFFFATALIGCQTKSNPRMDEEIMLKEELDKIDWTKVDTYPTVDLCDTITDIQLKKECFFDYVTQNLQVRLNQDTITGNFDNLDTLKILVTVQPDSKVKFQLYEIPDSLQGMTKAIDEFLQRQSKDFSVVHPALKRGVPVKSQFVVPVQLNKQ
ncbi:hypothetical protein HX017_16060 [Myroides marinus]|uniref:Uncharacterized protein n=1 Tax=Myroides marinus TaxID=703342 RepID=A0A163ZZP2_9FLAO|nr:hypothetical protein [Myroides marinus]KZE82747.1 hypothetical protein AV926_06470 [Myroides marinus]MDM1348575.1 hypothetical protein [Myroides marinus]MDM1352094.1 hypothetical protein [Myroides marinus]MDM1355676.1 hypothetical protein [Myroides marinus]MDM1359301.1 hypothetical protein [Myroides marinus]